MRNKWQESFRKTCFNGFRVEYLWGIFFFLAQTHSALSESSEEVSLSQLRSAQLMGGRAETGVEKLTEFGV